MLLDPADQVDTLAGAATPNRGLQDPGDRGFDCGEFHPVHEDTPAGQFCDQAPVPITLKGTTGKWICFFLREYECQRQSDHDVTLNVPSIYAYIDIFGLGSGTILSSAAKATTWKGVLPQTQDYVIEVYSKIMAR